MEANLIENGSFDSVVDGCDGVFHTTTHVLFKLTDPHAELIKSAEEGTLNALRSCSKVPSLRRVVETSSITTVTMNRNPKGPNVVVYETWFSDPMWYALAKTLAEQAAWKFVEKRALIW
ncbi:hypothetical protein ACS0TY_013106 [Phlomoides rotata]